jgi:AcrR family transcriptional regulator
MTRKSTRAARPLRADAQRNDKRLIEVAHKVFTEQGPEASMEEIARRARVGIGTLYRHFPTRNDILETVYAEQIEALIARAYQLRDSLPPKEAFAAWLQAEAEHMMTYKALKACLVSSGNGKHSPGEWKERLVEAGATLLKAAEKAGAVRGGLDAADLLRLVHAITAAAEKAPDSNAQTRLLLGIMMDGLAKKPS